MPNDVVHFLASPSAPVLLVEEVLEIAFQDIDSSANGLHNIMTNDVIGVACDIYRCAKAILSATLSHNSCATVCALCVQNQTAKGQTCKTGTL